MRIGIITTWFERGGAYVSRAYRDILAQKHEVFIYARTGEYAKGDPNWDLDYVTWGRVCTSRATAVDFVDLKGWVKRHGIEMLIFNEQWDFTAVVFCRRYLDVAIGAYVDYYRANTVEFFDLYDFLLCNTKRHYSVFKHHPRALYIPWGTDCCLFQGTGERVYPDCVVFFHSSGLSPDRKGTRVALEAFRLLSGNSRFVWHSQVPISAWPELEQIARSDRRVEVLEGAIHAPGLFHLGDVYVYPTVLEGIGLTIVEALACGLPVIVPDVAPMNEFVRHGENGRLVPPFEYRGRWDGYYWPECYCAPEAVAEPMRYYLDNQERLRDEKRKAMAFAREHLDWKKNASHLPEIVEELKDSKRLRTDLHALEEKVFREAVLPPGKAIVMRMIRRRLWFRRIFRRIPALQWWAYR